MDSEEKRVIDALEDLIGSHIKGRRKTRERKRNVMQLEYIQKRGHIRELILKRCKLTSLPDIFGDLKYLEKLDLSMNELKRLPESFRQLKYLNELNLEDTDMKEVPNQIIDLSSLQLLNLGNNQLTTLPTSFANLQSLKTLYLYSNKFLTIPESLLQLESLENLGLSNNQLTNLPEFFGTLTSLLWLSLDSNHLLELPESFGQLKSLEELHLGNNSLTILPESFGQLKSLQTLNLRSNELETLPESFRNLVALKTLNLGYNKLTTLPESFGNLRSLQDLNLCSSNLTKLPSSFSDLKSLRILDISEYSLETMNTETFIETIIKLESLRNLEFSNYTFTIDQWLELLKHQNAEIRDLIIKNGTDFESSEVTLKKLNNYLLNYLGSLQLGISDEEMTADRFIINLIRKLYNEHPEFSPEFDKFMKQLKEKYETSKKTYTKDATACESNSIKIIALFWQDVNFQKPISSWINDNKELKEVILQSTKEILGKIEPLLQKVYDAIFNASENIDKFYEEYQSTEKRKDFYDKLVQFIYNFNNIQAAIPIIWDLDVEGPEKDIQKVKAKIFCINCYQCSEITLFEKEKKKWSEKIKNLMKKTLSIIAIIGSFSSIISGIFAITNTVPSYFENILKNTHKITESVGFLANDIEEIKETLNEIRKPTAEFKIIDPSKEIEFTQEMNQLRLKILEEIEEVETKNALKDLVDNCKDVQSLFRRDISGFYVHKNCGAISK